MCMTGTISKTSYRRHSLWLRICRIHIKRTILSCMSKAQISTPHWTSPNMDRMQQKRRISSKASNLTFKTWNISRISQTARILSNWDRFYKTDWGNKGSLRHILSSKITFKSRLLTKIPRRHPRNHRITCSTEICWRKSSTSSLPNNFKEMWNSFTPFLLWRISKWWRTSRTHKKNPLNSPRKNKINFEIYII